MRDRHEHQVEDLRATLEASLNAPDARPSRWTPQLVDMRRQQKRLVRERKFGEALDLLKAAETRETEEIEWHRQTMRREHDYSLYLFIFFICLLILGILILCFISF